ncbi:carboxylesterase [Priestia megaterium]|uniref:alpha/beta hydrolase n=1 Tax=Priestia megaterium TaxID=1404 RepID=UPI000BFBAE5C|nr:alpha/beta fold hydrolase [Priestia megaterium]PGK31675.1 carboxylesterase [Priestia megaterium]
MKVITPKSFTYRGGNKAVLLLHGFTGNTRDIRLLGRYLNERGYTCHAPLYKGHGLDPTELMNTNPEDWWQDVLNGYHFLKHEGFKEITVAGVSLGGTFSLKIASELPVKAIVSMSAPVKSNTVEGLLKRVLDYAIWYKKLEGKTEEQISGEIDQLQKRRTNSLEKLQQLIINVYQELPSISSPTLILQGSLDDSLYQESAKIIYEKTSSENKKLIWYEQSRHIITLDKEREKVYEDVYKFLNHLT